MAGGREGFQISAKLQKGVPDVQIELDEQMTDRIIEAVRLQKAEEGDGDGTGRKRISISLEQLDVDLAHNQSFGMMRASTGCISNPGGPGC